jgi:hypothetical protein
MSEIINTKGLPSPFVEAITYSDFLPAGNLSAYRLQEPPQITRLKKENRVDEDVADKVWTLISRALVQVIENGSSSLRNARSFANVIQFISDISKSELDESKKAVMLNMITTLDAISSEHLPLDERYIMRQSYGIDVDTSFTVFKDTPEEATYTGSVSVFDTIPLYDKQDKVLYYPRLCDTMHAKKSEMRESWVREANIQALILRSNGYDVESIRCIMVFKDWTRAKSLTMKDYPTKQIEVMSLPVRDNAKVSAFVKARAAQHLRLQHGDVAPCSPSDRWSEADQYVVVRKGRSRVERRSLTYDEAVTWLAMNRDRFYDAEVRTLPGKSRRCESYCPVRDFCKQWEKIKSETYEERD